MPQPNISLLTNELPRHIKIALSQIGTIEYSGAPSNPQIDKYLEVIQMPGNDVIPWCSAFVNWCLDKAGIYATYNGMARSFLNWAYPIDNPKIGDVVILSRGISRTKGHVGFYMDHSTSNRAKKGWIYLLGGNQNDRVGINAYQSSRVLGYRRYILKNAEYFNNNRNREIINET